MLGVLRECDAEGEECRWGNLEVEFHSGAMHLYG